MNKHETRRDGSSFELGESSEMQGLNLTFSNSFGVNDYMEPQDFTVQDDFEVELSALFRLSFLFFFNLSWFSTISPNYGNPYSPGALAQNKVAQALEMAKMQQL